MSRLQKWKEISYLDLYSTNRLQEEDLKKAWKKRREAALQKVSARIMNRLNLDNPFMSPDAWQVMLNQAKNHR